jgi:hypothetical protein
MRAPGIRNKRTIGLLQELQRLLDKHEFDPIDQMVRWAKSARSLEFRFKACKTLIDIQVATGAVDTETTQMVLGWYESEQDAQAGGVDVERTQH